MTLRQTTILTLQALCWGSAYIFIAAALDAFAPTQIVFARCALAALMLAALIRVQGQSVRAALGELRARPRPALLLGVVGNVVPFLLIAAGQRAVPAGLTGVLMASVPLWTAGLAVRLDPDETIDGRQGAGLVVGLVGVGLVVGVDAVHTAAEAVGVLAILAAAGLYAFAGFVIKRHYTGVPPATRGLAALTVSSALLLPVGAGAGAVHFALVPALSVVLLAAASTAAGMLLLFQLIDELGPRRASLTSYLAPGFSLILAALLLGESITIAAIVGLVLIVAGVVVASRPRAAAPVATRAHAPHTRARGRELHAVDARA